MLIGSSLLVRRKRKLSIALIIAALLVISLSGNRWVSYSLARSLEWRYLPIGESQSAEAIVLLGGGTEPSHSPRSAVEMNAAGDRMIHAADLFHSGSAPIILLSGGNISWMESTENSPAADMREILLKLGIPEEKMILQNKSQNTFEDAKYSAEILNSLKIKRILLVTSAMHMPRSVALFEKQGFDVIPSPTDFTITMEGWNKTFSPNFETFLTNLLPNSSSLGLTTNVLKEYIGMMMYQWQGWL
jgi:uncharacterized SAM-binding protein YcdF (DUF218 family)